MNWQYEYFENMLGLKKVSLNRGSGNTLFDTYSFEEYEYDLAGNPYRYRVGSSDWNVVSSTKNNQTSQINYARDAVIPIRGKASSSATLNVSVDGVQQAYTRPNQEEFAYGLNAYSSVKKFQEIKVEAVDTDNTTTPPTTIKTMQRGKTYVEATPENFVYDNNGNLSSDGRWNYTWNAENRLIGIETTTAAVTAGTPKEKYVYSYDWTGRKVKSGRYEYEDNAWVLVSTNKRYYDDYNLIYETTEYADGSSSDVRKYYYGVDLLGSVYGSAGTGGLRMIDVNGELCYTFNNQVGSIEALYGADADTAAQTRAEYVYSAYGEIMMKSGDLADKNNITYSTRYQEANTGLVSYTYRHYSPRLKKWINKDPIAEQGGINLYQMVGNDPVRCWDLLGLSWKKSKREGGKIEYIGEWPYDNEKTLSNIIRLNAGEYSKWASDEEIDEEECTISVKVPNTILAIWAGDGRWFGRVYTNWDSQVRRLKNNYHVVEVDGNKKNPMSTLEDLVKKSELYGIFFWGHGSKNKNGNYLGLTVKGGYLSFANIRDKLKYKLGFLDLHACGTLAGEDLATPDATKNLFEGTMYPLPGGWGIEF